MTGKISKPEKITKHVCEVGWVEEGSGDKVLYRASEGDIWECDRCGSRYIYQLISYFPFLKGKMFKAFDWVNES